MYFGLHGNTKHTSLEVSNITHGIFPSSHPYAGLQYYGLDGLLDKTLKLGVHTDYVRPTENNMRVPVIDNDPWSGDLGGSIARYLEKLAPGQTRLYCKPVPESKRKTESGSKDFFMEQCLLAEMA